MRPLVQTPSKSDHPFLRYGYFLAGCRICTLGAIELCTFASMKNGLVPPVFDLNQNPPSSRGGVLPKKTTPRLWKSMERCPCQRGFTDASHMHRLCSTLVEGGFERVNVRNNFFLNLPQSVCISSENRQKPIKYHFLKSSLLLFNPFGPEFPREWQFFHRSLWYVFKNPFKFLQIGRQEVDNCIRLEEY